MDTEPRYKFNGKYYTGLELTEKLEQYEKTLKEINKTGR